MVNSNCSMNGDDVSERSLYIFLFLLGLILISLLARVAGGA